MSASEHESDVSWHESDSSDESEFEWSNEEDEVSESDDEAIEVRNPWFRVPDQELDRDDPYPFFEETGPRRVPPVGSPPIAYVSLFLTIGLLDIFVKETNDYATLFLQTATLKANSLARNWVATSIKEMKAFLAIIINMGLNRKPNIKAYWTKSRSQRTPWFGEVMSRTRFELLLKFFHLTDNRKLAKPGQPNYDPCAKFQLLVDHSNGVFNRHYKPHRQVCIDESLVGTKNKTELIQYMPNKHHHKWGIKFYMLCDCCVCSDRKKAGGRKRSRTMCSNCQKGLHGPCYPKHKC